MRFASFVTSEHTDGGLLRNRKDPPLLPVTLPRDELRHPHTMEWWYFIAYFETASGAGASLLCSAIRKTMLTDVTNCMLKITDYDLGPWPFMECGQPLAGAYHESQSPVSFAIDYAHGGLTRITCFDGGWKIEGKPGDYRLSGSVGGDPKAAHDFDLRFFATHPPALLRGTGIMDYGNGYQLAYYVRPKIQITGTFALRGAPEPVTGFGWYERQWGSWPGDRFGWKYLNLHLDDGEQWLIFSSKRNGLPCRYAARFPAAGGIEEYDVRAEDFHDVQHGAYGSGTDVTVDVRGSRVRFVVEPLHVDDPSLRSRYPLMPKIWEGVSKVTCHWPGRTVSGIGTTEIKPYE
jgi:predicted secreted hydrolase